MELRELSADERVALVGLVEMAVVADGKVSSDELAGVKELTDAFGTDGYRGALDAFAARFPDEDSFRVFLAGLGRQDARDLIFGTVLEAAGTSLLSGGEADLLDWLAKTWNVTVEIADEP